MCHTPKKDFYTKFISEPLPIESDLAHNLHDHLSAEVVSGTIESIQDAIDWITWTLMYRRISKNPNYYEIAGKTGQHINDFLSELIEDTVADLAEAGCITVKENEMDVEPANIGRIASFYYIKYQTIEIFAKSLLVEGVKMKQLLEILS
jgi:pre-mRNA-splicing helicase BRR2